MTFKDFAEQDLKSMGLDPDRYFGMIILFKNIVNKYLNAPDPICPKCKRKRFLYIEQGNRLRCSVCNTVFDSPKAPIDQ